MSAACGRGVEGPFGVQDGPRPETTEHAAAKALVLALALTLPLAMHAIPYAYASTSSSSYTVSASSAGFNANVHCNSGDYATGGGAATNFPSALVTNLPEAYSSSSGSYSTSFSGVPNAWGGSSTQAGLAVFVVCQTPITVAGIGVPEFGSLYVAIALAAVVYFALTVLRQKRTAPAAPLSGQSL
jgi:hypothetical protein